MLFLLMHVPNPPFPFYLIKFSVPLLLLSKHFISFLLLQSGQSFLSFLLSLMSLKFFCSKHLMHLLLHSVSICFSLWSIHLTLVIKDTFLFWSLLSHICTFLVYCCNFLLLHSLDSFHVFLLICESVWIVFLVFFKHLSMFHIFILVFLSLNCICFKFCSLLTNSLTVKLIYLTTDLCTHDSFHLLFYLCFFFQF